jgi:hypothetical protein
MNITEQLKKWLIETCGVKADATDDEFRKAASTALVDGKLTAEKYLELTKESEEDEVNEFDKKFDRIADALEGITKQLTAKEEPKEEPKAKAPEKEPETKPKEKAPEPSRMAKAMVELGGTPAEIDGKGVDVRVKEAAESYSTTKTALHYPNRTQKGHPHSFAEKRVTNQGRPLDESSDLDKALSGVWSKFQIMSATPRIAGSAQRAWEMMTDHEKGLLCHLAENTYWDNSEDYRSRMRKGYPGGIKTLIDDAAGGSGGLEAAPIVFDDNVIQTPLLHGELYPLVNEVPLDRGRRIEGVATGTVTGSWGGIDDTSITLFTTTNYVTAFDTTIFRWEGAIKIGLDFLSDTPIDFQSHITAQYGQRLLEDLDDVIADGNGTTQPEGIVNKSGVTSVTFGSATNLGNYESLRFGVAKPEHGPSVKNTAVFCGNETSYQRAKAIPVGGTDARRIGGMDYDSYLWMQRPYKINETMTNLQIFYAILGRYRMYRRKGFTVRTSTEGDTLIRDNSMVIVVMSRYGGQLERGAAAALTTDAPA